MSDFFNQFRQNLEQRPAPQFEENDWLAFQKRLDSLRENRPAFAGWWWLFLPLLASSLAANGLLFREIKQSKKVVSSLEIHRDTVLLTRLIYQTDTVFQTRLVYLTVSEMKNGIAREGLRPDTHRLQVSDLRIGEARKDENQENPGTQAGDLLTSRVGLETLTSDSIFLKTNKKSAADSTAVAARFSEKQSTVEPSLFEKNRADSTATIEIIKAHKTLSEHLAILWPTSFETGFSAGVAVPLGSFAVWQPGPSVGLQVVAWFSERLRMQFSGGWANPGFDSKTLDSVLEIPEIQPPSDDFKISSVDGHQPHGHFSAEMQWRFWPEKRWNPVVGFGYGAGWRLPFQATYDFKNTLTGAEWIWEESVSGDDTPVGFGLVSMGVERSFSKKWTAFGRANWRFQPESASALRPGQLDFQAGMRFSLAPGKN